MKNDLIIKKLCEGDEKFFDELFLKYEPKLHAFINGIIHHKEDTENLIQDIFVNLWKNRTSLCNIRDIDSYLFIAARNEAFRYLKKSLRNVSEDINKLDIKDDVSAEDDLLMKELLDYIYKVLDTMPKQRKKVFLMSRRDGLSNEQIANTLHISRRTVESHIYSTLVLLRQQILVFLLAFFYQNNM